MKKIKELSKQDKISLGVIIIMILSMTIAMFPYEKIINNKKTSNINYKVIEKIDFSKGDTIKYIVDVVIYDKATSEDLELVSKIIVEKIKNEGDFNALAIFYYDEKDYIPYNLNTLGTITYAPSGDWDKAAIISSGDYTTMEYRFNLKNKDWEQKPEKKDIEIHTFYNETYNSLEEEGLYNKKEYITEKTYKKVKEKFNIETKDIDDILKRYKDWESNHIEINLGKEKDK